MDQALQHLRGTGGAPGAPAHRFARPPLDRRAAHRADGGHLEPTLLPRALLREHSDDLGDHLTGPLDDHVIPDPDVLAPHLILVVERGVAHDDPGDPDRLEIGHGGERAGAADVDRNVPDARFGLLGRELVGDRPPGGVGRVTELLPLGKVVDLDHHAVDLIVEVVAVLEPAVTEGVDLLE